MRGRVYGIAKEYDCLFDHTHFACDDRSHVKRGAKRQRDAVTGLVAVAARCERTANVAETTDAPAVLEAVTGFPGYNDFFTDIFMNLTARGEDWLGGVTNEIVQQEMKGQVADPLGNRRRSD